MACLEHTGPFCRPKHLAWPRKSFQAVGHLTTRSLWGLPLVSLPHLHCHCCGQIFAVLCQPACQLLLFVRSGRWAAERCTWTKMDDKTSNLVKITLFTKTRQDLPPPLGRPKLRPVSDHGLSSFKGFLLLNS